MSSERLDTVDEILSNQLENNLGDEDILRKEDIVDSTEEEYPNAMAVYTGGTSGSPIKVPYHEDVLSTQLDNVADVLSLSGVNEDDYVMNAAAPKPHISGWDIRNGSYRLGADVASNESYEDWYELAGTDEAEDVTVIASVPAVADQMIEWSEGSEYESLEEVFPNLRLGIFSADQVLPSDRRKFKDEFGFETINEVYASSELNFMAGGQDESSWEIPKLDNYIFELIPKGEQIRQDNLVDVREAENGEIGYIVVTDPERKAINMTRYLQGDIVKIKQRYEAPRIKIEGRDSALNLGGAQIDEVAINSALRNSSEKGEDHLWLAEQEGTRGNIEANFYVRNSEKVNEQEFFNQMMDNSPSLSEAYELDIFEWQLMDMEEYAGEEENMKRDRIIQ